MTSTSKSLPDFLYGYLDVPNVLICVACVQVSWCLKIAKVLKFIVAMVIFDGETSVVVFGIHLLYSRYGFGFSSVVACLD